MEASSSAAASLTGDDSYRLAGRQRQETASPPAVTSHFTVSPRLFPVSPSVSPHAAGLGSNLRSDSVKCEKRKMTDCSRLSLENWTNNQSEVSEEFRTDCWKKANPLFCRLMNRSSYFPWRKCQIFAASSFLKVEICCFICHLWQ